MDSEAPEATGAKQSTKFQPGLSGNPHGRPKGSRNKLGEQFIEALQQDFEANGTAAIVKVREERPVAYLKVIASILPKILHVNTNALGDMDDAELAGLLDGLRALVAAGPVAEARSRATEAQRH